ncbi:hypothetical protein G3I67_14865 [Orrella sp. NBD-18]|uniref:Uncharacterized protein n=1 Tax=Sheuella amnicola TaxID=2707330 RepID=A0A6B2R443_9BURK|nr:hypothetical protein [Sheuella amnicola]NDY84504.1 hypothetical protein [Sheuella amnicola]
MRADLEVTVNRTLILIMPLQPALDWLFATDPSLIQQISLDSLRQEQDAYLVSEDKFNSPDDAKRWVERHWKEFFSQFLGAWYVDESLWPKGRTLNMFKEWFEVQHHSMVWDLSRDPLIREQLD